MSKQVKHTIQLEFTIPENHGDLCWTSEGCGVQMYYDLLVVNAKSQLFEAKMDLILAVSKRAAATESDIQYGEWLENKIALIDAIKITNIGTEGNK
jgi:hypothetical protein